MRSKLIVPCVAVAVAVLGSSTSALAFTEPGPPDAYDAPFRIDAGSLTGDAALGADGTAYLAYKQAQSSGAVARLCVLPLGKRACSSIATLTGPAETFGAPQVYVVGPQEIHVVAQTCCDPSDNSGNGSVGQFVSTDGGRTFGAYADLGSLANLSQSARVGGNVVWVSGTSGGGTVAQSAPLSGGSGIVTASALVSTDTQDSAVAALPDSTVMIANDDFNTGPTITHVEIARPGTDLNAAGSWSLVSTFASEQLIGVVSGPGGTFLATIAGQPGVLDPPVRIRHWNGTAFDAATTLPRPGNGDDSRYTFVEDAGGRLHAFWIGARENSRTWHSISTDGGRTWRARLLGGAPALSGESDINVGALDATGAGVLLETPAAAAFEVVQPIVVTQTLTLSAVKRTITKPAKASFKGKVSPARPGATVSLEMKQGSAWKIVGRTKERADGSFIVKVGASATHVYRAFVGGVFGRYDQGSSASVKVTVKAP